MRAQFRVIESDSNRKEPEVSDRNRPQYLRTLAQFAAATQLSDISEAARARARWVIADSIPVIAAGMQEPEMKAFVTRQLANAAAGNAWVIGAGRRLSSAVSISTLKILSSSSQPQL